MKAAAVLVLCGASLASAQPNRRGAAGPPSFEDYPATEAFRGPLAAPRIRRVEEREFRTAIREGISKGYGVRREPEGREGLGPNFAAHYTVVRWGCGTDCLLTAIVDGKSGRILPPPRVGTSGAYFDGGHVDFRLNSRLMIASTNCEWNHPGRCGRDYFVLDRGRFRRVFHEPRP